MTIDIIPAIDLIDGQCVRLTKGDYSQKRVYSSDPAEVAQSFENAGLKFLHLIDLDGAKSRHVVNHMVLQNICKETSLQVDFGGGVKTEDDVKLVFDCGATQVNCGSIASDSPELFKSWIHKYGAEKMILSADVRGNKIATHGWKKDSGKDIISFIEQFSSSGLKYLTCTDIETDGMLSGPNFSLFKKLKNIFRDLVITASGGISDMKDIQQLNADQIHRVIVGKAIYENRISLNELVPEENAD